MNLDEDVKRAQRVLDISKVAFMHHLPGTLMRDNVALNAYADVFLDTMMVRLTSYVLTEQLVNETQTVTMDVPASWWQHFKLTHFPAWLVRRMPTKMKSLTKDVTFQVKGTYPYANISLPIEELGRRVIFETVEQSPWRGKNEDSSNDLA